MRSYIFPVMLIILDLGAAVVYGIPVTYARQYTGLPRLCLILRLRFEEVEE